MSSEENQKRPAEDMLSDDAAKKARMEVDDSSISTPIPESHSTSASVPPPPTPAPAPAVTPREAPAPTPTGVTPCDTTPAPAPEPGPLDHLTGPHRRLAEPTSKTGLKASIPPMPSSLEYIDGSKVDLTARRGFVGEHEVGIRAFVGDHRGVRGVIKQRFTDFLVNEVGLDGQVLHLKDIGKPVEPDQEKGKGKSQEDKSVLATPSSSAVEASAEVVQDDTELPESLRFEAHPQWPKSATARLRSCLSDETVIALRALLVEGKDPGPKSDAGWGSRPTPKAEVPAAGGEESATNEEEAGNVGAAASSSGGRGQGRDRGRGRGRGGDRGRGGAGGRGGRGGAAGGGGEGKWWTAYGDDREVVSQPIPVKDERTAAHKVIREALNGLFESSTRDEKVIIKWARGDSGRGNSTRTNDRQKLGQYIHFTLHKSNRETMDALSHLQRSIGCQNKELTVCGTKDKRAVTVQRVCLKRNGRNLQHVWRAANGIKQGWKTEELALIERGDRGIRIGDLSYEERYLELGMLKGNAFVITLRNVQTESREEIDRTMTSVRDQGFVNYFGMQRFGTSSMPTHLTGLYILQQQWTKAVDSILCLREGEHPDCVVARLAWLEDGDIGKALELMPRRSVAERCVWEFWKKNGRVEDKVGALGNIPRNLRTMYVHAYQSYVWNMVVSERIKASSTQPLEGDLVFVDKEATADGDEPKDVPAHAKDRKGRPVRKWATTSSPEVKALTEEDIASGTYTIFDVIIPLPGWDVDYPTGKIGEVYEGMMKADGLDPKRMRREQREYSLPGSYRRMVLRPLSCTWTHINYTDPDLALVQSDEDRLLNLNPPAEDDPAGKFKALKIELTLGSATYATMVLREITREETSTWHQIGLTMSGGDRGYKGSGGAEVGEGEGGDEAEAAGEGVEGEIPTERTAGESDQKAKPE